MRTRGWTVCVFILTLSLAYGLREIRWCTISEAEMVKCNKMKAAFQSAKIQPTLSCILHKSTKDCMEKIATREADAVTLNGEDIYHAGKKHNLMPVVGEYYNQEFGASYYAVAVVHKSDNSININNLHQKKSCHTGYGRTAGWDVPIGYLVDSGRMSMMACAFGEAVGEFFSKSCIPGSSSMGFPLNLCSLCIGNGQDKYKCEANNNELYYSYNGAFRCLAEQVGDVAFIKNSTVFDNTDGKNAEEWAKGLNSSDYQLLCRDGSRAEVTEWHTCHLAKVPSRAVVVRSDTEIFNFLNAGQQHFGANSSGFKMFESDVYGGIDLMFKDTTTELIQILNKTYEAWLGPEYLGAMRGLDCSSDSVPTLRWCTQSTGELQKCSDMAIAFNKEKLKPTVHCVSAKNPVDCMQKIKNRDIDAVKMDAQQIYTAGKEYGLVPAVGESYSGEDDAAMYFAVAVVKRESHNSFTINDLKGKKSCHTGVGRSAGWTIPVGLLIERGALKISNCNYGKALSEFFSASCLPGASEHRYPSNLCDLCIGDNQGKAKCASTSEEQYSGHAGAFRCLQEAGEVAFVKHTTVSENTDGNNQDPWAKYLKSSDYQLLCLNGARAEVDQWKQCHWARVPSHAVMVHPSTPTSVVFGLLDKAQEFFGNDTNPNGFKMFDSSNYIGTDLIFKDSTLKLTPVGEKNTYLKWIGENYFKAFKNLECSGAVIPSASFWLLILLSLLLAHCHM
ncbi:melanotransferrin [Callorhinchus milii]|uniref:melanotransferrin n=1 Tax=Callorhinchus milii TaxID=7868 RepID=UPI001C3FC3FA|nr:melanotransferrin [Callorhinchus milii]